VHVSGSVLAVNCAAPIAFFPDIYNEDWLFFFDDASMKRLGSSGFCAEQVEYNPFADPERAARQEFGDVLAEGLYALLQNERHGNATYDYWVHFLKARKDFLNAILARAGRGQWQIRDSVLAALECLAHIRPDRCEGYIRNWRHDLQSWNRRLDDFPVVDSTAEA